MHGHMNVRLFWFVPYISSFNALQAVFVYAVPRNDRKCGSIQMLLQFF